MAIRVLKEKERPLTEAVSNAMKAIGAVGCPINVLALYLDSPMDMAKAYVEAKRQLGVAQVCIIPSPLRLSVTAYADVVTVLKEAGVAEAERNKIAARIIRAIS
jgi:2-methylisocitrate lyase-like PEP mutase family enzyme